jgi:DNA-binding MarR family transcriptional regulator
MLQTYQTNEGIAYLLSRVQSLLAHMVTQRTQVELGITGTQASLLFMVGGGRCSTAGELARGYGIDASTVTRLLDRVEKRGLLLRKRSSDDRRIVRLELTRTGRELADRMPEIFVSVLERAVEGLTPEEVDILKRMLRQIHANCSN